MKICITNVNEWFPVYEIEEEVECCDEEDTYDIPEEKIEWIKRVFEEFKEMQKYLEKLCKEREERLND